MNIIKLTIFFILFSIIIFTGGAMACKLHHLEKGHWVSEVKTKLEELVLKNKNQQKIVVFDFDNTIVSRDIGEATFAALVLDKKIPKNKDYLKLALEFTIGNRTVSVENASSLTAYYEDFLEATGYDKDEKTPYSNAYAWIVQIMAGLTPADVITYTQKAYQKGIGEKDSSNRSETMINGYRVPFFYPEMIDLVGFFIANGFNVYVLTASNILSVRYLVTKELNPKIQEKYGTTIALLPDHVIGVSTLMKDKRDGKLYKDEYLVKKNTRYRELNLKELQNYELTYELAYPLPAYEGKIAMIFKHISHDRPFFITGDSPNDHPMLEWAENRLWIARLEKNDYQEKTAKLIKESDKTKWLIQPVLYKKSPGFIASKKELVERIKVHHDEQKKLERSIAIFKQQVLLQQF